MKIKDRCYNPSDKSYPNYGGRGIEVCEKWLASFECFLADMGARPSPRHSIDRINNEGGYYPGNCRWATAVEQANNKRNNRFISVDGVAKTVAQWAVEGDVTASSISGRLDRGWQSDLAATDPKSPKGTKQFLEIGGVRKTVAEWAACSGVSSPTIRKRLNDGASPQDAIAATGVKHKRLLTMNGETKSVADWARHVGISEFTLHRRLSMGWTESDAILTPVGSRKGSR